MSTTYRLALLDVDGTLRDEGGWKPHARSLIAGLSGAGLQVALCSGRNGESLVGLADEGPEIGYVAAGSGALVLARGTSGWTRLAARYLDVETVGWVWAEAAAVGMEVWAYTDTRWLVTEVNDRVRVEAALVGTSAQVGPIVGRADVVKLMAFPEATRQYAALGRISDRDGLAVVQSNPGFYDIVLAESVAAKGGDVLTAHLGLDWGQVLAMGDGENDLGMLGRAGLALAMAPLRCATLAPARPGQHRFDCPDLGAAMGHLVELGVLPPG